MSRTIHLFCVGKLKKDELKNLEKEYCKRINSFQFKIHELKANSAYPAAEARLIADKLKTINNSKMIYLLDEKGKNVTSHQFAKIIKNIFENNNDIVFIIGGALGHHQTTKTLYPALSLSSLTLPHQLARLLMVEQIYRAHTLLTGHPYHNN